MALRFLEVLAPAHLEDVHFLAAAVRDYRRLDGRAGDEGRADLDRVALADQQQLIEGHRRADVRRQRFDAQLGAGLNAVLLPAGLDDCVHWIYLPRLPKILKPKMLKPVATA